MGSTEKNKIKLVLLDEILGMSVHDASGREEYEDAKDRIIRVSVRNELGGFEFSKVQCFQVTGEGFKPVHCYQYPKEIFTERDFRLDIMYCFGEIFVTDFEEDVEHPDWGQYEPIVAKLRKVPEEVCRPPQEEVQLYRLRGNTIAIGDYEYYYLYGKLKKRLGNTWDEGVRMRNVVTEYQYKKADVYYWSDALLPPLVSGEQLIVVRQMKCYPQYEVPIKRAIDVRFFDLDLQLVRQEVIPVDLELPLHFSYCYDETTDTLFFGRASLNLSTGQVQELECEIDGMMLGCLDGDKNIYVVKGKTLYVLDNEMCILSKHRFKGTGLYYFINAKGNFCLVTESDFVERPEDLKVNSAIRLYEVQRK